MSQYTRRRGGPVPYLRTPLDIKVREGLAVLERVTAGATFRQAAAELGLSLTTAWRRYWFVLDWTLPGHYGQPSGPIPPLRGTAACPRGRPWMPTLDGPGRPLGRRPATRRKVTTDGQD